MLLVVDITGLDIAPSVSLPSTTVEDVEPLTSIVVVTVDQSSECLFVNTLKAPRWAPICRGPPLDSVMPDSSAAEDVPTGKVG